MINLEYEKICDEVLDCDKNIRYVGVYNFGELQDKILEGLKSYLTREETEISLSQVVYRNGQHGEKLQIKWEIPYLQ